MNLLGSILLLAAAVTLSDEERQSVEVWLFWIQFGLALSVVSLVGFALTLRTIAKRTTEPCRWCMEFVPKKSSVCPRCGKARGVDGVSQKAG
jgi:hypothetical protein